MLPWKLRKRQFLPVNQNLSSVHFSLAKFQLVSSNLALAMIWQMTHNHKLPKLCSATLSSCTSSHAARVIQNGRKMGLEGGITACLGEKFWQLWRTSRNGGRLISRRKLGFCTLCFCFPTKMLHLNAPFFPLKCSVSPKKSLKCSDNDHYTNSFLN